jgi:alpha-galactosidase
MGPCATAMGPGATNWVIVRVVAALAVGLALAPAARAAPGAPAAPGSADQIAISQAQAADQAAQDHALGGLARAARALGIAEASVIGTPSAQHPRYAPYMGVDTWYAFGTAINEPTVVALTNWVVSSGLEAAGYRYVWLDAGWWSGARDASGNIVVDPSQWPHGMAWLAAYIHSKGLLAGIYTDTGIAGCANAGSDGHYQQDVDTFAVWGFDAVKVDDCGGQMMHADPRPAYAAFAQAISQDQPHRPMLLNICNGAETGHYGGTWPPFEDSAQDSYSFAPAIATSWRTSGDVGAPGSVPFVNVLHNLDLDAAHPEAAGHGHFNDPDYIAPNQGMSFDQARAQFTMWVMLAAPLMLSVNPASLPANTLAWLTDPEAIAISQDPLGVQARAISTQGTVQVWVKPLSRGQVAVALLNRGPTAQEASFTSDLIGLGSDTLVVRRVWSHSTSVQSGPVVTTVPATGVTLMRVAGVPSLVEGARLASRFSS